jgi:integrase
LVIFQPDDIQTWLRENLSVVGPNGTRGQVARLNNRMKMREGISAAWEVAVVRALMQLGEVRFEKPHEDGGSRPDIWFRFANSGAEFIADITAISDDGLRAGNQFTELNLILMRMKQKLGIGHLGTRLDVGGREVGTYGDSKTRLALPPNRDLEEFAHRTFLQFLIEVKKDPSLPHGHTVQENGIDVRISYHPDSARFGGGGYDDYTLAEAREIATEQRKIRREFGDPILVRKKRKQDLRDLVDSMKTFEEAAQACWESHKPKWTPHYAEDWLNSLKAHVYPVLGSMEIRSIRTTHVEGVLKPIWHEKAETASRVRSRIEKVFNFAKGKEWYSEDNPAAWEGNLDALLIESPRLKKLVNHPSLPFSQIGAFTEVLRREKGTAARALEFLILTASRSLEIRGAMGEEFDLEKALWTVPAVRMKAGKEHVVPLSPRAVEIIRGMGKLQEGKFVFPGGKPETCLSDAAMNALIKRMDAHRKEAEQKGWCDLKGKRIVPHGFRATFKTWGQDSTDFNRQVIEFALAHGLPDKTEAAYSRGAMITKRRPLMDAWALYCAGNGSERKFKRVKDYADSEPKIVKVEVFD